MTATAEAIEESAPFVVTEAGIYDNIPEDAYHRDPVPKGSLSSTGARKLLPPSCPAKFRWERDHPIHKKVFDFGSAAHKLVLGAGAQIAVVDADDWRTKDAKAQRDEAWSCGQVPVLRADWDRAAEMAEAVRAHPLAKELHLFDPAHGHAEQSMFWQDPETGVWCRSRTDWLRDTAPGWRTLVVDYKTADNANPEAFTKSAASYGYDQQDAFYCDGLTAIGVDDDPAFLFVVQEKTPPYLVSVCELDRADRAAGGRRNRLAIEIFRDCKAADAWPGYSTEINHVSLPAWARARNLMGDF